MTVAGSILHAKLFILCHFLICARCCVLKAAVSSCGGLLAVDVRWIIMICSYYLGSKRSICWLLIGSGIQADDIEVVGSSLGMSVRVPSLPN